MAATPEKHGVVKTLAEMSPAERQAATDRVCRKLEAEMRTPAFQAILRDDAPNADIDAQAARDDDFRRDEMGKPGACIITEPETDAALVTRALEAALDTACRVIQDALGVTTGDFASIYFSGDTADLELSVPTLRTYLYAQRRGHEREQKAEQREIDCPQCDGDVAGCPDGHCDYCNDTGRAPEPAAES